MFGGLLKSKREASWLAETCHTPTSTEDRRWKSFEHWIEQYEPAKVQPDKPKKEPNALERRARKALLDAIHSGIVKKVLLLVRETTSKFLGSAELDLRRQAGISDDVSSSPLTTPEEETAEVGTGDESDTADRPPSTPQSVEKTDSSDEAISPVPPIPSENDLDGDSREVSALSARLLNAVNAIVLTYRFADSDDKKKANDGKKKFAYLRRVASYDVADTLWDGLSSVPDTAKRMLELQIQIRAALERRKEEAMEVVGTVLDRILEDLACRLDERVEQLERHLDLDEAERKVGEELAVVGEVVLDAYGVQVPDDVSSVHADKRDEMRERLAGRRDEVREELLATFRTVVRVFVMRRIGRLTARMAMALDELLGLVNVAYEESKAREDAGLEELREEMFRKVESMNEDVENRVSADARKVIVMIGAMDSASQEEEES